MSFGERLGALLDRKREDRGWSFAQLALEIHGDDGQGGDSRKSDMEKFCRGGTKKPRAATLLKLRKSGLINKEEIDACRTPQELELAHFAERLFAVIAEAAKGMGVEEGLAAEIAERYAEGNAGDFDAALAGLQRALEIAAERPPATNQPAEVDAIIAEAKRLNQESLERGTQALEEALQAQKDKQAEAEQATLSLLDAAIDQAILTRSVGDAVRHTLDKLGSEVPDKGGRFEALRVIQDEWYKRGRDKGLGFDLEVSIALAEASQSIGKGPNQIGAALNDLGIALSCLGARESGTTRLEQAVAAYKKALLEWTRERVPLDWAGTQNNLGNALGILGSQENERTRLEQAVEAYEAALLEWTRERAPLNWATTQNNLGNALRNLGSRESGPKRLEQAVAAYEAALLEWTRERVPLDWAMTQNNLGNALQNLGERESGAARLEQSVEAYEAALLEWTREQVPLDWAMSFGNQGVALSLLSERTGDVSIADRAIAQIAEAEEVMRDGEHIPFADYYARQLPVAQERRAAMVGEDGG